VYGSTTATFWTGRTSLRRADGKLGSCIRSKLYFTASALNGVPSWNFTPCRSVRVTVLPSALIVQALASIGTIWRFSSVSTSLSKRFW